MRFFFFFFGKSILQVPDTGTRVLDNTTPFLCSSIVSFWITLACSKERKYHIFGRYWYTLNVPVLVNTGTFQYLGPEVYFFLFFFPEQQTCQIWLVTALFSMKYGTWFLITRYKTEHRAEEVCCIKCFIVSVMSLNVYFDKQVHKKLGKNLLNQTRTEKQMRAAALRHTCYFFLAI